MTRKLEIAIGSKYGRLTVVGEAEKLHALSGRRMLVKCECGKEFATLLYSVTAGHTRSCGCLRLSTWHATHSSVTRHGQCRNGTETSEYKAWCTLRARCYNKSNQNYKDYGGRGIRVCARWLESFENFIEDMGRKPSPRHSIDRIDNDGNYEPGNCRWATMKEQSNNRRPMSTYQRRSGA